MSDPSPASAQDSLGAQIVAVATRHFYRYGFKSVTMDDIARALGISKKTLYQVVDNKQDLVDLVVDADIAADEAAVVDARQQSVDAIDEMVRIARYFTASMREMNPGTVYDLHKYYRPAWERIDAHHSTKMIEHVRANLRRGQAEGLYRLEIDRELIAHLFMQMPKMFMDGETYRVAEDKWGHVLTELMRYHLLGVCSDEGRRRLATYSFEPSRPES